jgi:hypothetical protein
MLRSNPTISIEGLNAYLDTVNSKLAVCENLLNEAPMLFPKLFGLDDCIVLICPSCNFC